MGFVEVEVEFNANVEEDVSLRFVALGASRQVKAVRVWHSTDQGEWCDVVGWDPAGPCSAVVTQVDDSGDGTAWVVVGGKWGLRLKPRGDKSAWAIDGISQWGEAYLKLSDESDLEL